MNTMNNTVANIAIEVVKVARFVREQTSKERDMTRAKQRKDKRHERTAYAAY